MESEEARKARLEKERQAQGRTLWEQLEEQKARKKEEYDAVTKQIFGASVLLPRLCLIPRRLVSLFSPVYAQTAPTKALDEEEAAYLEGIRRREENREKRRAEEEERELAAFGACCLGLLYVCMCMSLDSPSFI